MIIHLGPPSVIDETGGLVIKIDLFSWRIRLSTRDWVTENSVLTFPVNFHIVYFEVKDPGHNLDPVFRDQFM